MSGQSARPATLSTTSPPAPKLPIPAFVPLVTARCTVSTLAIAQDAGRALRACVEALERAAAGQDIRKEAERLLGGVDWRRVEVVGAVQTEPELAPIERETPTLDLGNLEDIE